MVRQGYSQFPLSNLIYVKAVFTTRNGNLHCKNTAVITQESIYFSKLNISLSIDFPVSS